MRKQPGLNRMVVVNDKMGSIYWHFGLVLPNLCEFWFHQSKNCLFVKVASLFQVSCSEASADVAKPLLKYKPQSPNIADWEPFAHRGEAALRES